MVATPLDDEELFARADLAGEAFVLSAANAHATLRFTKVFKGRPEGRGRFARLGFRRRAIVRFHEMAGSLSDSGEWTPYLGSWTDEDAYRPGSLVRTHLVWNAEDRVYKTLWWNAVTRLR